MSYKLDIQRSISTSWFGDLANEPATGSLQSAKVFGIVMQHRAFYAGSGKDATSWDQLTW